MARAKEKEQAEGRCDYAAVLGTPAAEALAELLRRLGEHHPRTLTHCRRVAIHAADLAEELGLTAAPVTRIRAAALLHDVGKLRTPPAIVDKPAALNHHEFSEIRRHAHEGARIVAVLGDERVTEIVRHHHERFDGCGYPAGLQGYEIPLGARIVAVADTYDALTSPRPYRAPLPPERALDLVEQGAGCQFDPTVVGVALRLAGRPRPRRPRARSAPRPDSAAATAPGPRPRPRAG